MEPTSPAPSDGVPATPGELIVSAGRHKGTRLALKSPVTFVGRADGCDLRLDADGVLPFHCVIAAGPEGLSLRACQPDGTRVNGRPATLAPLQDGDEVQVGPCTFTVRAPAADEAHREALRIQAAAVVAQQAALTEEELGLRERQTAFQRQEQQLAAHLEERRRQLVDLQEQLGEARAKLRRERADFERQAEALTREATEARRSADEREQQARSERQRLQALRGRFARRWKRHWSAQRKQVEAGRAEVERARQQIERERSRIDEARQRFNGTAESEKRQLAEAWGQLEREQSRWQEERRTQEADFRRREQELAERETKLAQAERALQAERAGVEKRCAALRAEADGLEARIANARSALQELERQRAASATASLAVPDFVPAPPSAANADGTDAEALRHLEHELQAAEEELARRRAHLDRVAGELADQRWALREQTERLALAQRTWAEEQQCFLEELEALAGQVREQEQDLAGRAEALDDFEARLRHTEAAQRHARLNLEAWQSRLAVRESDWQGERDRGRADLLSRSRQAERREQALAELCRRWSERRRQEVQELRAELERCAALRRAWAAQTAEGEKRAAGLQEQQARLAEQALALEQARQELLGQVENPALAERRLERLRRHLSAAGAKAEVALEQRRRTLAAEAADLDRRFRAAQQRIEEAGRRERELADRLAEWERQQHLAEQQSSGHDDSAAVWVRQRDGYEQQLAELREEIERLAGLLLDGEPRGEAPAARAA